MRKSNPSQDLSIYEASAFWDEHDFSEFEDIRETREIKFHLLRRKYVGLDPSLYAKVRKHARKLHISEDALIHEWLLEKAGA